MTAKHLNARQRHTVILTQGRLFGLFAAPFRVNGLRAPRFADFGWSCGPLRWKNRALTDRARCLAARCSSFSGKGTPCFTAATFPQEVRRSIRIRRLTAVRTSGLDNGSGHSEHAVPEHLSRGWHGAHSPRALMCSVMTLKVVDLLCALNVGYTSQLCNGCGSVGA